MKHRILLLLAATLSLLSLQTLAGPLDEALFREHPERLAQGVARHVEALGQSRFGQPGARGDVAVEAWVLVPIVFKLHGN